MTEIKLKIFEPLDNYFKFLYTINDNSYNNAESKYLSDIKNFISEDCDSSVKTSGKKDVSNKFKEAMKAFAYNVREADAPISRVTIKGPLKMLAGQVFKGDKLEAANITKFVNDLNKAVKNDDKMKKVFDMDERISSSGTDTFAESLKNKLNTFGKELSKDEVIATIDQWLLEVFQMYGNSINYFNYFMSYIVSEAKKKFKIPKYRLDLLNKYFEIRPSGKDIYSVSKVLGDGGETNWGMLQSVITSSSPLPLPLQLQNARLNVKVDKMYDMAEICKLFPKEQQEEFNNYLISVKSPITSKYEVHDKCWLPESKNVENIMKYTEKMSLDLTRRTGADYERDTEDDDDYNDGSGPHKLDYYKEELNKPEYQDLWRMDREGDIYKRENGKYIKYNTDENIKKDIADFENKDKCGNLCIYDDAEECRKFFRDILNKEGKTFNIDEMDNFVNNPNFLKNFNSLRNNIVNVNPVYVLGTLKAFGFEKWSSLGPNGKEVKVESFSRWWQRMGNKIMAKSIANVAKTEKENLESVIYNLKSDKKLNEFIINNLKVEISNYEHTLRKYISNVNELNNQLFSLEQYIAKLESEGKDIGELTTIRDETKEKFENITKKTFQKVHFGKNEIKSISSDDTTSQGEREVVKEDVEEDVEEVVEEVYNQIHHKLSEVNDDDDVSKFAEILGDDVSVITDASEYISETSNNLYKVLPEETVTTFQEEGEVPTIGEVPTEEEPIYSGGSFNNRRKLRGGVAPNDKHKFLDRNNNLFDPLPPQNLELFLKLLVDFINNNKFVLNPVTKQLVNSPQLKTSIYPKEVDEALYNTEMIKVKDSKGNIFEIRNGSYIPPEKRRHESSESLASALETSRKINQFKPHHITLRDMGYLGVMGSVFDVLLETIYDLNPNQNIMNVPGLSFTGYSGPITGGSKTLKSKKMIGGEPDINNVLDEIKKGNSAEAIKMINQIPRPCTGNALLTYNNINATLKKHGKQLETNLSNEIGHNLSQLYTSEKILSRDLNILAKFARILNAVPEEIAENEIVLHRAQQIIDDYNKRSSRVAKYSNNLYDLMGRLEKSSSYGPL